MFVKRPAGYLLAARTALASQGGPDVHTLACKADGTAPSPSETQGLVELLSFFLLAPSA